MNAYLIDRCLELIAKHGHTHGVWFHGRENGLYREMIDHGRYEMQTAQ